MSNPSAAISSIKLRDILVGKAKPSDDREATLAATALMWKQAFETAMRPVAEEGSDPLAAPQRQSIRETQAQWMGIEAAIAFGKSLGNQLGHVSAKSLDGQPSPVSVENKPLDRRSS